MIRNLPHMKEAHHSMMFARRGIAALMFRPEYGRQIRPDSGQVKQVRL
jgi:hypothetical protein